jgi:IS30 family transposase
MSNKEIAAHIGRDPSVVCREVKRHGGRQAYRAHRAERDAAEQRKRPKCRKLDADLALREQVVAGLRIGWSPEQIAGRLRREHGYRDSGKVASHEAIYTWIYALPKGEPAAQGIQLRHGREQRRPRGRAKSTGARIVGMRSIEDRPAEVAGRAVPGHWEGDLIIGKAGKSAAATLVERTSRFTAIIALPDGRTADAVCDALIDHVPDLPGRLINSITWDQGSEMAQHTRLSLATEIDVYFAHPHSPWERGTNENTNGLIREYLPKGTNIPVDQLLMNDIADSLNNRPRKVLGFMTPAEKMVELLTASIAPID